MCIRDRVNLQNCPVALNSIAKIFQKISDLGVNVDMISLAPSHGAYTTISFKMCIRDSYQPVLHTFPAFFRPVFSRLPFAAESALLGLRLLRQGRAIADLLDRCDDLLRVDLRLIVGNCHLVRQKADIDAVSYTHLDVYKRQRANTASKKLVSASW